MLSPFRFLHSLGALLTVATVSLRAFDLQTDESGVYTVKWHQSPVALDIRLPNTTALSDGRTAAISVRDAATTWNDHIEVLRFTTTVGSVTPRVAGNGRDVGLRPLNMASGVGSRRSP